MKKRVNLLLALILGVVSLASAQKSDWNWPEDVKTAKEKYVLYTDSKNMGKNREAANALYWLLVNAPDLNPAIYIHGAEIYSDLVDAEKDPAKQKVYQDSVLTIYDLRIKHFGDEADNLDKKAFYAYKYFKDDKGRYKQLYEMLNRVVELNGEKTSYASAVAFMDVVRRHKLVNKTLTDEQVLTHYDQVMAAMDYQIANSSEPEKLEKYKAIIDDLLVKTIKVDCNYINSTFGPKLKSNPKDVGLAKNVFKLLRVGKCTDSELYLKSLKIVFESEPTAGVAEYLAVKSMDDKKYDEAEKYFNRAIELTETSAKKAEGYLSLAQLSAKRGRKSESRSLAYKAVEADPSVASKAYTHIGNLYMNSQECYGKVSLVEDRAIYLAAYEMYKKAGNSSAMEAAAKQFPSAEEIFAENREVGQPLTVGCWINEKVTLQKR